MPIGRVRILEDRDGDGVFDRGTVFARDLSWPTGIALYDGGAFVAATPDIWYLKDTDGDLRADIRRKVFTGFRKFNVQAVMNNLIWGLDHKIYGAGSSNGGTISCPEWPAAKPVILSRHDFRFDPATLQLEAISGGARFGNAFDDWGNRFVCNIRNPAQHVVLPSHYLARNRYLPVSSVLHDVAEAGDQLPVYRTSPPEPWRAVRARRWAAERDKSYPRSETAAEGFFTSSSGVTIYRGAAYPREFAQQIFLGEVAGNLIHRQAMSADGVTFTSRRADPNEEFVTSDDNWFRPVNFVNAPDGTLHVLDMYRETIEHPWSIPDDIKAYLDLESGRDRGRIYRLSPPAFRVPAPPRLGSASTEELVRELENPNAWWRETAQRLIVQRRDPAATAVLSELLRTSRVPLARLHALWSLAGLQVLQDDQILAALSDECAGIREHAVRLAEPRLKSFPALLDRVAELAADGEIRVRFQVAFSLGEVHDPRATAALVAIMRRDATDPWMRVALLSSLVEDAHLVMLGLLAENPPAADASQLPFLRQLGVVVGARNRANEVDQILTSLASLPATSTARAIQMQAVLGLGDGLQRARSSIGQRLAQGDASAARLIEELLDDAAELARDARLTVVARQGAIELVKYGTFARARPVMVPLLDAKEPREVQLAAARALASFADPDVSSTLLELWRGYSPALRSEIVELLLARTERIPAVLDAVETGIVPSSHISSARRALLLTHSDSAIKSRANDLLAGDSPSPRKEVIARYRPSLQLPSDRLRGKQIFERECVTCHRLDGKGFDIGPSLSTIRHRSPAEVLLHILDPNREVAPNFMQYVVATDDGRISTGVIAQESITSITLRRAENVTEDILRENIRELSTTEKSLMPEGLEAKVSVQEMADLLQYLLGS